MNVTFLLLPGRISLKFASPTERDAFWSTLGKSKRNGFVAAAAAERVGTRTIRFHPEKAREGFEWPINGAEPVPVSAQPASTPHQPTSANVREPAAAAAPPQSVVTNNPFGFGAKVTSKPLPGLMPLPPASMLAVGQPTAPEPAQSPTVQEFAPPPTAADIGAGGIIPQPPLPAPQPPPHDDPKPEGHHMSKAVRAWRERQLAKQQQMK